MLDGVDCFLDLILERGLHAASRAGWLVHLACFQLVAVAVLSVAEESTVRTSESAHYGRKN